MKRTVFLTAAILAVLTGQQVGAEWDSHRGYGAEDSYGYWYDEPTSERPDRSPDFFFELEGQGDWIVLDDLGEVWVPSVRSDWRPYSCGYWTWSHYGWFWIAYEPWGYLVHHYGRWTNHPFYGWVWIPGYRWAPAWVAWNYGPSYVGWAPIPYWYRDHPYSHGYHSYGHYSHGHIDIDIDFNWWVWIPSSRFHTREISRMILPTDEVRRRIRWPGRSRHTALGPERATVERVTGSRFHEMELNESTRQVGGRTVKMVRPRGQLENVRKGAPEVKTRFLKPTAPGRVRSGHGKSGSPPVWKEPRTSKEQPAHRGPTHSERPRTYKDAPPARHKPPSQRPAAGGKTQMKRPGGVTGSKPSGQISTKGKGDQKPPPKAQNKQKTQPKKKNGKLSKKGDSSEEEDDKKKPGTLSK